MPVLVQSPFTTMALSSMILILLLSPNIAECSLETQHKKKKLRSWHQHHHFMANR